MGFTGYRKAFDYVNNIKSLGKWEFQKVSLSLYEIYRQDRKFGFGSWNVKVGNIQNVVKQDCLQIGKGMRHCIYCFLTCIMNMY